MSGAGGRPHWLVRVAIATVLVLCSWAAVVGATWALCVLTGARP